MHSATATIYCSNPACQASNPESHKFCQQCRTPLPKRYLWMVGKGVSNLRPGDLLSDRYFVKQGQVVLDTRPAFLPASPEEISKGLEPYLRLSPYQLHVPQIYGWVRSPRKLATGDILLLEQVPIYPEGIEDAQGNGLEGTLMPTLSAAWKQSGALRQLSWLWQIAQLWQPLSSEGVAASLLTADLLRVEGSLVRLLELRTDAKRTPTLVELGQLWKQWASEAQPAIADFLRSLCQQMQQGAVQSAEQLVVVLDRALEAYGQSQQRQVQISTSTDQGPTRQRNEDACYPPSGTVLTLTNPVFPAGPNPVPLLVICDGIGGHEGGNVASNLAITTVQQQLSQVSAANSPPDPVTLITQLEQATLAANDAISQRNDNEQRQERQRMGTTLVMALIQGHELYLTHVGDSRAYRITATGCHQVTQDDDLASREVRLGYSLYRDALQQPGSGSLVQALGMSASSMVHPTVQRFVLEEDCLFLLCSDGLSDHDRVEEHWQAELLPVLAGKVDLATATQRLIAIANSQNGHDNVTIGLVHCRVSPNAAPVAVDAALATLPEFPGAALNTAPPTELLNPASATIKTQMLRPRRSSNPLRVLLGIVTLWLLGGGLVYLLMPEVRSWVASVINPEHDNSPQRTLPAQPTPDASTSPGAPTALTVGALLQVIPDPNAASQPLTIAPLPPASQPQPSPETSGGTPIPSGSVLQISARRKLAEMDWVQITLCSTPEASGNLETIQAGSTGWIQASTLLPRVTQNFTLTTSQLGQCTPAAAVPASPSVTPAPGASPSVTPAKPAPKPSAKATHKPQ